MPDTKQQPAKDSTSARSFRTVIFSLNKNRDKTITIDGAVYSKIAAVERLISVIA